MLSRGIARNGSRKSQDLEVLSNNLPSTHGQARRGAGGGGGIGTPLLDLSLNNAWF